MNKKALSILLILILTFITACSIAEPSGTSSTMYIVSTDNCTAHATTHENAGDDEVSVTDLSGLLADDQHVLDAEVLAVASDLDHSADHENAGSDEISVIDLSGLLADDQHILDAEVKSLIDIHSTNETAHHEEISAGSAVIWKATSERILSDLNRTTTLAYTDLDLTAYTSAEATMAFVTFTIILDSYTSGIVRMKIRENGSVSPYVPVCYASISEVANNAWGYTSPIGLDASQVMEYTIEVTGTAQVDSYIDVVGYIE